MKHFPKKYTFYLFFLEHRIYWDMFREIILKAGAEQKLL
jgi:hypothetical protein